MEIRGGELIRNDTNQNAMGGTEIIATALYEKLDKELLKEFQIVHSRVRELDESKIRVWVAHDLPGDPESEFLKNGGHEKFHKLVFVSNWQMQKYIDYYRLPWSKCVVIHNAIEPIEAHTKPTDTIRLGYWSTPHRGLNIVVPVFDRLCQKYDNIELEVYSSFSLYGWDQRDEPFQQLFDICKNHPKINYHGSQDNATIRNALKDMHILAYPSIWQETSCLVLMEAMSAGLICVHPNFGALYETAANWTYMYQWSEDLSSHATIFHMMLDSAIQNVGSEAEQMRLSSQKSYADLYYGWTSRVHTWNAFLKSMVDSNLDRSFPKAMFVYRG